MADRETAESRLKVGELQVEWRATNERAGSPSFENASETNRTGKSAREGKLDPEENTAAPTIQRHLNQQTPHDQVAATSRSVEQLE